MALGRLAWTALPMALVLGAAAQGAAVLWRKALADPAFAVGGDTWEMGGAARQCGPAQEELARLGRLARGRSLFDSALAADLRAAYEASPWVREVTGIRRVFPDRLSVEFRLRQPAAQAWIGGRWWLVDAEGVALPASAASAAEPAGGLPEIVEGTPGALGGRPAPGLPWGGRGIRDALGLLMALWASPLADEVAPARVTVFAGAYRDASGAPRERPPRLEVTSWDGRVIRWGTFNADGVPEELGTAHKLRALDEALRLAPARPGWVLDVHTRTTGLAAR